LRLSLGLSKGTQLIDNIFPLHRRGLVAAGCDQPAAMNAVTHIFQKFMKSQSFTLFFSRF
jgi:hypothetical protein